MLPMSFDLKLRECTNVAASFVDVGSGGVALTAGVGA